MIVNLFLENAYKNLDKYAIISKNKNKTYKEFLIDIQKVLNYLKKNNINKKTRVLMLINMSYEMYVSMFASILNGLEIVVIDNFKDIKRVNKQLISVDVKNVFVSNKTSILKNIFKPLRKKNKINVEKIIKKSKLDEITFDKNINIDLDQNVLITYTSGGTSNPKAVFRTLNDLTKQMNLTMDLVSDIKEDDVVLATLPIYSLLCLVNGLTIYLPKKKEDLNDVINKVKPTIMFSSISKILKIKKEAKPVKNLYFGGSILYNTEAKQIKKMFKNAKIIYIYGATEASIVSTTNLDDYLDTLNQNKLCLGKVNNKMNVEIIDDEIVVSSTLLTNNYVNIKKQDKHFTKDLGYLEDNKIYITGRRVKDNIISDYILEMIVKKEFDDIFNIAILKQDGSYHIYLEEKDIEKRHKIISILDNHIDGGILKIVKKLPLDYRHESKIDYKKLLKEVM